MFVIKQKNDGSVRQVGEDTFNGWCELFSKILNQRVHPHLMRSSRATNLVVYDHRDLETAQKLLGHESSETTKIYVVKDDESDAFEAFI